MIDAFLKAGKEKSLARHHPWVFSGAVDKVSAEPQPGETVRIRSHGGAVLGLAAYSPKSQIRARVWTFDARLSIDARFFADRIAQSIGRRRKHLPGMGMRLVHGESDGLPGLIVDRYGDTLVAQFLSTGAEKWRGEIADALQEATGLTDIYERSDADVRQLEGLAPRSGPLRGAPPESAHIEEHGIRMSVDIANGHKTGFYLDQSENRRIVRDLAAARPGMETLNCFCYTGGFSLSLLAGGAGHVTSIDSSGPALEIAHANVQANGLDHKRAEWREDDVFNALRDMRNTGRSFDLIVLDPPKFAPTPASVERAARAYKDINLLGFKLLKPGGRLVTFSCSGGVSADLFQKIVAGAALDAGIDALIEQRLSGAADHPVRLAFPEGEYLKGLILRRD